MTEFEVLDLKCDADRARALAAWQGSGHRDPHAHPAYTEFFARRIGAQPRSIVGSWPGGTVIMPVCVRAVPGTDDLDAITPYGYGGAYVSGSVGAAAFAAAWRAWATEHELVSLVIRRNVVPGAVLASIGSCAHAMDNVVIDVSGGPHAVWRGFEGRVRTDCRRSEQLGVRVVIEDPRAKLGQFHRLYTDTMRMRAASPFYFFGRDDLEELIDQMPQSVILCSAYLGSELIAAEMHLIGAHQAYYFLSGSSAAARQTRAHHLMKFRTSTWLFEQGVPRFVLGGGMRRGDSLFQYKRSFAPAGVVPFLVEYQEFHPSRAAALLSARKAANPGWTPDPTYYPSYRDPRVE